MARVSLFGCIHINRRSVVVEDFRSVATDADALAVEFPVHEDGLRGLLRQVLLAPIFFLGANAIGLLVFGPLGMLVCRDVVSPELSAAQSIADERDVHFVDRPPSRIVAEEPGVWVPVNWAIFVGLVAFAPVATILLATLCLVPSLATTLRLRTGYRIPAVALYLVGTLATAWALFSVPPARLVVLVLAMGYLVAMMTTIDDRDEVMIEEVEALVEANDYDHVCLATGKNHLRGQIQRLDETDLELADVFVQEWLRNGAFADPESVLDQYTVGDESVDLDASRTDGVLRLRAIAAVVDAVGIAVTAIAALALGVVVSGGVGVGFEEPVVTLGDVEISPVAVVSVSWLLLPFGYYFALETVAGRTAGHAVTGVEVVSLDGDGVRAYQAAIRTLYRLLDFLPVGYVVGAIVAHSGDGTRRLGDRVAGTAVVRAEED